MNKKEFMVISTALIAAYPNAKIMCDTASLEFWYRMLADVDAAVAENAVMEHIATNIFPPSIAEIRKLCIDRTSEPILSTDEAWGTVQSAMSKYGYYNPQQAFETMDELTLSVVKNLGWNRLCQSENATADRANFRMAYEAKAKEKQTNRQLPAFVEERKLQIQQRYAPAIEQKQAPQIEKEETTEKRVELTDEQLRAREKSLAEVRRRILGGTKTE